MVQRSVGCGKSHLICRAIIPTQIEDQSNRDRDSLGRWFPVHFGKRAVDVADHRVRGHTARSWTTTSTRPVYKNGLMIMQARPRSSCLCGSTITLISLRPIIYASLRRSQVVRAAAPSGARQWLPILYGVGDLERALAAQDDFTPRRSVGHVQNVFLFTNTFLGYTMNQGRSEDGRHGGGLSFVNTFMRVHNSPLQLRPRPRYIRRWWSASRAGRWCCVPPKHLRVARRWVRPSVVREPAGASGHRTQTIFRTPGLRVRLMCPTRPSPAIVQRARRRLMPLTRCDKAELIGDEYDWDRVFRLHFMFRVICCIRSARASQARTPRSTTCSGCVPTEGSGRWTSARSWSVETPTAPVIAWSPRRTPTW